MVLMLDKDVQIAYGIRMNSDDIMVLLLDTRYTDGNTVLMLDKMEFSYAYWIKAAFYYLCYCTGGTHL